MNIIARPFGSDLCYCRPDTTWEKENKDLYSHESVNEWHWAPVLFARICKAGKCISPKFASRYYDGFCFGILLYDNPEQGLAFSSCADHTSVLPHPLYNPVVMENEDNTFRMFRDCTEIFSSAPCKDFIEDTICKASQRTSLRIGDLVAVELAQQAPLAHRSDGEIALKATFCDNPVFDFRIIF